ncbi:MAG: hypothetical protein P8L66_04580 [Rhodospirillaceae bacterium]|nr:hypothetical protein [Rhodospirillaceae bacterium]
MSIIPEVRRTDRFLSEKDTLTMLEQGFSGTLSTVGSGGQP